MLATIYILVGLVWTGFLIGTADDPKDVINPVSICVGILTWPMVMGISLGSGFKTRRNRREKALQEEKKKEKKMLKAFEELEKELDIKN